MNNVQITIVGRLGDDPRTFSTRSGADGVELRLAAEVPTQGGDSITRWIKVTAFGLLATRTAASVRKGDRVVVQADDVFAESWTTDAGEARGRVTLRARDIAASMLYDELRTGHASRRTARAAAADGQPTDLPVHEEAEARVLAGLTT